MTGDPPKTEAAESEKGEVRLTGTTICPGVGIGRAYMLDRDVVPTRDITTPDHVPNEQERYSGAIKTAYDQLREHVQEAHQTRFNQAAMILGMHQAMLADDSFHGRVRERIASDHKNAEWALEEEAAQLVRQLEQTRDPYFRARAEDVRDLVNTILSILSGGSTAQQVTASGLEESQVLISAHLYPSDAMLAERSSAAGFASESRALNAHAAILLKALAVPTVAAVSGLAQAARQGDQVVVDAMNESVILRPEPATLQKYLAVKSQPEVSAAAPRVACTTKDGIRVRLMANIENPHQVGFTQLRAILRASPGEQVGILLPMITTTEDVMRAKRHLEIAKEELRAQGQVFSNRLELGAMVEVPAAAVAVQGILAEVDFISVGTNDLLQYFMAADRDNEEVLQYGQADDPVFIWLLKFIIEQVMRVGREEDVTICGEMASSSNLMPLLLELGYRSFSISPVAAPSVRKAIEDVDLGEKSDERSAR